MSRLARQRWTICGVWTFPGGGALLVNVALPDGKPTTVCMVGYDDAHPVRITEAK